MPSGNLASECFECFCDYRFAPDGSGEFVDPLVTDVTEDKYVYVDRSEFGGDIGGEGLFAKAEIPSGTVFAYFGGSRSVLRSTE